MLCGSMAACCFGHWSVHLLGLFGAFLVLDCAVVSVVESPGLRDTMFSCFMVYIFYKFPYLLEYYIILHICYLVQNYAHIVFVAKVYKFSFSRHKMIKRIS
jgi:hypothetical protein